MRKLAITMALASTALAMPAVARDGSAYVGLEAGPMVVEDLDFDLELTTEPDPIIVTVDHEVGYDVALLAGYDFGLIRAEGEIAYKRAGIEEIPTQLITDLEGRTTALSAMVNALLDFGDEGPRGYVGGGVGLARVNMRAESDAPLQNDLLIRGSDTGLAWQLLAGVAFPISSNIDLGLKYRFFNVENVRFEANDGIQCGPFGCDDAGIAMDGKFRSHSLLATLTYNFFTPPPPPPPPVEVAPPPPPPPPPATQTCPDGSVILATEVCPAPPPPPPPPPPAPERG